MYHHININKDIFDIADHIFVRYMNTVKSENTKLTFFEKHLMSGEEKSKLPSLQKKRSILNAIRTSISETARISSSISARNGKKLVERYLKQWDAKHLENTKDYTEFRVFKVLRSTFSRFKSYTLGLKKASSILHNIYLGVLRRGFGECSSRDFTLEKHNRNRLKRVFRAFYAHTYKFSRFRYTLLLMKGVVGLKLHLVEEKEERRVMRVADCYRMYRRRLMLKACLVAFRGEATRKGNQGKEE